MGSPFPYPGVGPYVLKGSLVESLLAQNNNPHAGPSPQTEAERRAKEAARKKEKYKNIFIMPKGTKHNQFFGKVPHPEYYSPTDLETAQLLTQKNLNTNKMARGINFERVKSELMPKLSDMDKKLLNLPANMAELANISADPELRMAYNHLQSCFHNFFQHQWIIPVLINNGLIIILRQMITWRRQLYKI